MEVKYFLGLVLLFLGGRAEDWPPQDLSWPFDETTLVYPGGQNFKFTRQRVGKDPLLGVWYSANDFTVAEHGGTHLDAPYHFYQQGWTVGQIPLDRLLVKGVLVNVSDQCGGNPNYTLPVSELEAWEEAHGALPDNCVVLVRFGWSSRWPDRSLYFGPSNSQLSFPGLSPEAGRWLAHNRKVVGVGVDTASCDVATTEDYAVHIDLTRENIYILENLDLTKQLPPVFNLIVMPMKISEGTGAPCRVVATPLA